MSENPAVELVGMTTERIVEMTQLRGMIWWLASELATDDVGQGGDPEMWVALAEKHWRLGLRSETRFIEVKGAGE